MSLPVTSKNQTFAQKYPEYNRNETINADYTNKTAYKLAVKEQSGGYNASFNIINAEFNMPTRQMPYNQNFLGVKSSHYVPLPQRFKWDLSERNNSIQKTPDSSILFTGSQVPRAFS